MTGESIVLYNKVQVGTDAFNRPIYEDAAETIENVLIGAPSSEDVLNEMNLSGRRIAYTLAIPKGDAHSWDGVTVGFWGKRFRVIGDAAQGIEHLIPLAWNKKVNVELYE
jgi:hypothetical protein